MNDQTSNNDNDSEPWESEMTSEFDRRVRDLHEAPLTLDTVKGRAMNIQRKRRAAVAGGILVAAAVIVPVAVVAADGGNDRATEVPPAATDTPSPTAIDTPVDPPTDDPTTATPQDDAVPAYVEGTSFHRADGSVFELPAATYQSAVTLGERTIAYDRTPEGDGSTVDVIVDGAVTDSYPADFPFVISRSGETVAFVTTDGAVQTLWDDGEVVLAEGYAGWYPTTVVGGPDCIDAEAGGSGCRVFLEDAEGQGVPTGVDSHGIEDPVQGALRLRDADGAGRLALVTSLEDLGSCGGVYDENTSEQVFEQCDFTLGRFSPDGQHVLGNDAYLDGIGPSYAVVVDATTGDELLRLEPANGFINRQAWVDDDTIAATVFDFDTMSWSIQTLTMGADEPETLVGPVAGDEGDAPFYLVGD